MKLVIAEKSSVAQSLARVIGADKRQDGYLISLQKTGMLNHLKVIQCRLYSFNLFFRTAWLP